MAFHKDINPDTPQVRLKGFLAQVLDLAGKDLGMDLAPARGGAKGRACAGKLAQAGGQARQ